MSIVLEVVGVTEEKHGHMIHDTIMHVFKTMMPNIKSPVFIDVEVGLEDDMGEVKGFCHEDGYRQYVIAVNRDTLEDEEELITTIAHETVHIVQYLKKHVKDIAVDKKRWKGQVIDLNAVNYYELPWEVEAYSLQMPLANKIIKKYEV